MPRAATQRGPPSVKVEAILRVEKKLKRRLHGFPAPQFPQQSPSPSPSSVSQSVSQSVASTPVWVYAAPTCIPHSPGGGAWFACRVVLVSQSVVSQSASKPNKKIIIFLAGGKEGGSLFDIGDRYSCLSILDVFAIFVLAW